MRELKAEEYYQVSGGGGKRQQGSHGSNHGSNQGGSHGSNQDGGCDGGHVDPAAACKANGGFWIAGADGAFYCAFP
jgi:hypothetical protein